MGTSVEPSDIELGSIEDLQLPLEEKKEAEQEGREPLRLFLAGPTGVGKTEIAV